MRQSVRRFSVLMASCVSMLTVMASAAAPSKEQPATGAAPVLEDRYPQRRVAFADGVAGLADVTYSVLPGFRPLTLDLYVPPRPAPKTIGAPVIIYVHGGGWMTGHARHSGAFEDWPGVLASLAARGYVVASLNYRLSSEAPSPAAEQDVKAAIRWLRSNAALYGIDKSRIGIWGGSAGGQLAALAGTSCGVAALEPVAAAPAANAPLESDCVQSVVTWYGVFDFQPLATDVATGAAAIRYLGCTATECPPEKIALASATSYIDRADPPFLLIHGALDKTVAPSQSREFHAALQAAGVKSELLIIPGVDHSFIGPNAPTTRAASLQALQKTIEFFDATLAGNTQEGQGAPKR